MKDFPLLIETSNGSRYTVFSFDDFPPSKVTFKIIEYNTPSVAHPVWR